MTDAGTPGVSDPGAASSAARRKRVPVVSIPGPSAVTAAVAVSGLVEGPFFFLGFLPRKGEKRQKALERIAATAEPVVLFEAPNRIESTLADLGGGVARTRGVRMSRAHQAPRADPPRKPGRARRRGHPGPGRNDRRARPPLPVEATVSPEALDGAIVERLERGASPRTIAAELAPALGQPRRLVYARAVALGQRR